MILGLVSVIHAASLTVGWAFGTPHTPARPARPGMAAPTVVGPLGIPYIGFSPATGALLGFLLMGFPLTALALFYLIPRLLTVPDPI